MAANFEIRRSVYGPALDDPNSPSYTMRESVATVMAGSGGNAFNWTDGRQAIENNIAFPVNERGILGDTHDETNYPFFPLKASKASVEVWFRCYFGGTSFSAVTNIRLICSRLGLEGYGTGAYLNGRVADQYPTGDPSLVGGVNPFGGAGPLWLKPDHPGHTPSVKSIMQQSGSFDQGYLSLSPGTANGPGSPYSRYAVLQLVTGSEPTPGEGGRSEFSITYDES